MGASLPAEPILITAQVLDALPRATVVTDIDGLIVGWNQRAEALFGRSRAVALGWELRELVVPASNRAGWDAAFDMVIKSTGWEGDFRVERPDGTSVQIFAVMNPLREPDDAVVGVVVVAEDVTAQRSVEQQASDLAEHLRLALVAGDLGTWRWDRAAEAVVLDQRHERLFGLAQGTFDGTFDTWVSLLHPGDRSMVLDAVAAAVESGSSYQFEHRVVWPDGTIRWLQGRGSVTLDDEGVVTGTIGCTADITSTKEVEGAAIGRARAADAQFEGEHRLRERLEFLVGLTDASISVSEFREFMQAVTKAAVPRLGDWCSLHFIPEPGAQVELVVAHSDPEKLAWANGFADQYPYDPTATSRVPAVIRSGQFEFIPDVTQEVIDHALAASPFDRGEVQEILDALTLTSVITVPLVTQLGIIGAMQFVSAESGYHYDADDLSLARAAAGRIAAAVENMWLIDQQRHISEALQNSLLPPAVPRIPGLAVAVRYWPAGAASDVGGDFYDVFGLDERRWAIVIGDVCGTGPNAAAVTGIIRHTVRAAARHGQDHERVLEWINQAVLQSGYDIFCTSCYATIEVVAGGHRLVSISGGHPLPVVAKRGGDTASLGQPGSLLGVFDVIENCRAELLIEPGDVVVFYTDGITDLPPPDALTFEEVNVLVAEASGSQDAERIADAIHESLADRLPVTRRQDDIALVVLCATAVE